jgi:hypothetical protein
MVKRDENCAGITVEIEHIEAGIYLSRARDSLQIRTLQIALFNPVIVIINSATKQPLFRCGEFQVVHAIRLAATLGRRAEQGGS